MYLLNQFIEFADPFLRDVVVPCREYKALISEVPFFFFVSEMHRKCLSFIMIASHRVHLSYFSHHCLELGFEIFNMLSPLGGLISEILVLHFIKSHWSRLAIGHPDLAWA